MRLVISRQHPEPLAERLEHFAAAVEALAEGGEIARGDVEVGRLRHDALERAQVAVNVAEDQDLHGEFFCAGRRRAAAARAASCGARSIPFVSQPCSRTLPALVEHNLISEGLRAAASAV